jgi:hypothetical protein
MNGTTHTYAAGKSCADATGDGRHQKTRPTLR